MDHATREMQKVVLLIDEYEDERLILTTILEHYGYGVVAAATPAEGADLSRLRPPNLVILNLDLPGMDRLSAAQIRDRLGVAIPVIAVSTDDADAARVLRFGCDRFFSKPFLPRAILREVDTLIGPADDSRV